MSTKAWKVWCTEYPEDGHQVVYADTEKEAVFVGQGGEPETAMSVIRAPELDQARCRTPLGRQLRSWLGAEMMLAGARLLAAGKRLRALNPLSPFDEAQLRQEMRRNGWRPTPRAE